MIAEIRCVFLFGLYDWQLAMVAMRCYCFIHSCEFRFKFCFVCCFSSLSLSVNHFLFPFYLCSRIENLSILFRLVLCTQNRRMDDQNCNIKIWKKKQQILFWFEIWDVSFHFLLLSSSLLVASFDSMRVMIINVWANENKHICANDRSWWTVSCSDWLCVESMGRMGK